MGMQDRDWYREKEIDWERGGLREKNAKKRPGPNRLWWIAAAILIVLFLVLSRM